MLRSRDGKMTIIIIAAAAVLLLAGVAGFVLTGKGHGASAKEKVATSSLALGEFVVNLADQGTMHYLKTNVVLEVEGELATAEKGEGGSEADPKVRDAVIQVLSSRHMSELTQTAGKERLKQDLIAAVNKRLEGAKAVDVYFSDFAMQ